jgi:hypothetical protein
MWVKYSEQADEDTPDGVVFNQNLLGYNNIKTTLRWLHVPNRDFIHILRPLADIEGSLKK